MERNVPIKRSTNGRKSRGRLSQETQGMIRRNTRRGTE